MDDKICRTAKISWRKLLGKVSCHPELLDIPASSVHLFEESCIAVLLAFGSTYTCEQIFSHMKAVLSPQRSCLTPVHAEACVKLKVTKYTPDIEQLTKEMQGQGFH